MALAFSRIGLWMRDAWARRSGLTTVTLYLAVLEIVFLLWRVLAASPGAGVWAVIAGFGLALCLVAMGLRWVRRVLMWRLRNRLVITYIFIGVIPVVLLAAIALISTYLFAGQFATFVVTSRVYADLKSMQQVNRSIAENVAAQVASGADIRKTASTLRTGDREHTVTLWLQQGDKAQAYSVPESGKVVPLPSRELSRDASAVVIRDSALHLQAWTAVSAGKSQLTVITSQPLGTEQLQQIANGLGEIAISNESHLPGDTRMAALGGDVNSSQSHRRTNSGENIETTRILPRLSAGRLPRPQGRWDFELGFGGVFELVDWADGTPSSALLRVGTRPSLLYGRLFAALGEFAGRILIALETIVILFGLIELAALIIGIRLSRTMTRSVAALYDATQHINRGNLGHRIQVKSRDQLAALETSFNSMTESLERLIAEQKEKQRMQSELAIAQEVQAQLFPGESLQLQTLEVHGVCHPARTVSGDYYDFLQLGPERLGIAVGDISGKGISAALLMATIHSAVRVYEFGRMPQSEQLLAAGAAAVAEGVSCSANPGAIQSPAAVLALLNRHLFHSTPPEKYATLFLARWDGAVRRLTYSNGGHLAPLVFRADGSISRLATGGMVIGLFDNMEWDEGTVELRPGDLFLAYSDGVTEPENEFGEFGEQRLIEIVQEHREAPLSRVSELVVAAVKDWIGTGEQPDDLTLVLARAK